MKRYFNIAGPCVPDEHYMLTPSARCADMISLIDKKQYFVIHAARQTGKTTMLLSLAKDLEAGGKYHALYVSLETAQGFHDPEKGIPTVTRSVAAAWSMHPALKQHPFDYRRHADDITNMLRLTLTESLAWLDRPLVVLFDEADCLSNGTIITFLRQLREGYIKRSLSPFVHSLALVGMRNIRDYKGKIREDSQTLGSASPFNVVSASLTLRNFNRDEVAALYAQHTEETGQCFPPELVDMVYENTCGQPWLVNAIAREMVAEIGQNDPNIALTCAMAEKAIQNIILRRETHIDSLLERLKEPRVQRVVEPMLLGETGEVDPASDDVAFCLDLGLARMERGRLLPANPIYAEVIGRTLSWRTQFRMDEARLPYTLQRFGTPDGGLDMNAMLRDFQQFWRENGDIWSEKYEYKEAAPHLILMAFLQRVINGGGHIVREFATGRGRMDLIVEINGHRYPVEIKVRHKRKTKDDGIIQLNTYLDTLGIKEGWLVIFDRRPDIAWEEKIYQRDETTAEQRLIHLYGM